MADRVRLRAGFRCEYCLLPEAADPLPFQVDHVRARKHGGATTFDNLALCCAHCNARKGTNAAGYDPQSDELVRLFNPRSDRWSDHFAWQGSSQTGLTPIGRATVAVLDTNAKDKRDARGGLIADGLY